VPRAVVVNNPKEGVLMTRKVTVLAMCLMAAFAVSAVVSAISSASMVLPAFTGTATTGTGSSGEGALTIEGGATIKCKSSGSDSLTVESNRHLGAGTITFSTCTQGGEPCRSLGDASGTILTTGTWHLVLATRSSLDVHLFLFLLTELHIECPGAAVKLLLVTGTVAGLLTQKTGSKTAFELSIGTVGGAGKVQEFSEYENEAGTGVKTALSVKQEGGAAKKAFEESKTNELVFPSETGIEK
jgi:hypothetical protein